MSNLSVTPRATEKSYGLSKSNIYVFDAPKTANKHEISSAIEEQFGVTVKNIRTVVQRGKAIRFSKGKKARPGLTNRSDSKKAYVTLSEGDKIRVFDEVAPEETKVKTKKPEEKK